MKWINKGHEFDELYKKMSSKTKYYLFGSGDFGRHFYNIMKDEISIQGFIDNDKKKIGTTVMGEPILSIHEVDRCEESTGIIITLSQFHRISVINQLMELGYKLNEDCFVIENFLSIYNVYKYGKVYFTAISFLPSTTCNLNCRCCLNFNEFAKKYYVRNYESVVKDIDLFFQCVDRVMLFHVSGGEPMLYPHFAYVIAYIAEHYGDRIDTLRTVTNGTIVPSDETLKKLSKYEFELTVDDYRDAVPEHSGNFERLLEKLDEYHINYTVNKADYWLDLAPERTDYSNWTEEELCKHFDECSQSWQELRDGKLYSCNYDGYATVAGINDEQDEEVYDLSAHTNEKNKELVEFRLGYNGKGYTSLCKKCRGFSKKNTCVVKPAVQVSDKRKK